MVLHTNSEQREYISCDLYVGDSFAGVQKLNIRADTEIGTVLTLTAVMEKNNKDDVKLDKRRKKNFLYCSINEITIVYGSLINIRNTSREIVLPLSKTLACKPRHDRITEPSLAEYLRCVAIQSYVSVW